jgi:predicted metal-dependent phosphoesterase TrpH
MFIDLHLHTKCSDAAFTVKDAIKQAKKLKIGLAITDHNNIKGAIEAEKYKKVLTIPSIEVGTKENKHAVLHFYQAKELEEFYKKHIKNNKIKDKIFNWWRTKIPTTELVEKALEYNCIIVAAHPYNPILTDKNWTLETVPNMKKVHALEVLNSAIKKDWNKGAQKLAKELNKPGVAGSDAHCISNIGKAGIETNETEVENILNAIKKNKIKIKGETYDTISEIKHYREVIYNNIFPKKI